GIGVTHYPGLIQPDEQMAGLLDRTLNSDQVPEELKDPARWPEPMRREWADPLASAQEHRKRLVGGFRKVREALDAFDPDFVLIWGDDQYENFREDGVPSFCVFALDSVDSKPYARPGRSNANVWGAGPGRQPVAGRAGRLVELVARLPDAEKPLPLPRQCRRPCALRRIVLRQAGALARAVDRADRGCRPAGIPELGMPRRRDACAEARAGNRRLCREL